MSKKRLSELELTLKKLAILAKSYTDSKADAEKVHLIEKATANTGYLKTYILAAGVSTESAVTNENKIGEIDIPKDFLVKGGKMLSVEAGTGANEGKYMVVAENGTAVGTPYEAPTGVNAAGQWIDLIINTKDDDAAVSHIVISVNKLVDVYTNGNGLNLSNGAFSIKLNATNPGLAVDANGLKLILGTNTNGLSITANGLELTLASPSTAGVGGSAGAMSAKDKENLNKVNIDLLTDAELGSWFGYASNSAMVTTTLPAVSDDSLTDE